LLKNLCTYYVPDGEDARWDLGPVSLERGSIMGHKQITLSSVVRHSKHLFLTLYFGTLFTEKLKAEEKQKGQDS
jgi:hypothetical protein